MVKSGTIDAGISDHKMVYIVLNTNLLRPKAKTVITRSFKNFDTQSFLEDLSQVPFSVSYVFDDVDDVYWCWEKMYNQVLDDHAPIRSFKRRSHTGSPFITNEVRQYMRQRDATKKKYYKTRSSDWENYRKLRNKVVKMKRKATKEHFQQLCKEKRGDQKKFWKTIKPYINARKNQNTREETIM